MTTLKIELKLLLICLTKICTHPAIPESHVTKVTLLGLPQQRPDVQP